MKNILIPFFAILFSVVSCSPQITAPEEMPPLDIPFESLNEEIKITAPKFKNSFEAHDIIALNIEIIGDEEILFRPDYQNEMFIYTEEKWIEVFHTPPECKLENILLAPSEGSEFFIYPALPDLEEATLLRIFMFGTIRQDGELTEKRVGGYVDVVLEK